MSTKTSIKRIALVAVAALGLGMFSPSASNAADANLATVTASIGAGVPYAGEASGTVASVTLTTDATAPDFNKYSVTAAVTQVPSGASIPTVKFATTNTATLTGTAATTTSGVNFSNAVLIAGTYTITFTPNAASVIKGALTQTVSFTVTPRPTDAPRLTSINAVKAKYADTTSITTEDVSSGLVRDRVVVAAGATVASGTTGTIRLRADLISFPAGGYVNTFASLPTAATADLGNFKSLPAMASTANSNLVTLTQDAPGSFLECSPTNATHIPAVYTSGTNSITAGKEAGCDTVTARAGSAVAGSELAATGLGFYSFTPTVAGDYVLRIWQDADNDGTVNVNEVRRDITITIGAYPAFNQQYSTSVINGVMGTTGVATKISTAAGCGAQGALLCDEVVLAPKGTLTAAKPVAIIKVTLNDANGDPLDSRSTFPAVVASVASDKPGTVEISNSATPVGPVGRSVSYTPTSALVNTPGTKEIIYVHVYNDGYSGSTSVEIKVGGVSFATETLSFYGPVATVTATQGLKVLPATSGSYGCIAPSVTACDSSTVAKTPAIKLVAKDANGIAVPYVTYSSVSSADTTIADISALDPSAGGLTDPTTGSAWFQATVLSGNTIKSGATADLTFSTNIGTATAPVLVTADKKLTFALGGAASTAALAITGGSNVGDKSTMTFTVKDAAGNASFDKDHALALKSNIALTTAIGQLSATANALAVIGGTATIDFYNPLVSGEVSVSGLIDGLIAVSATKSVSNNVVEAAADAALEAIDAANAATDAANLAAEAADAATVAAEEARDAADAATAAVEALASEVNTLVAAIKAQIATVARTIAKIAKKVRA